jgi:hypothetical protein
MMSYMDAHIWHVLEILKHYYPRYTTRSTDLACTQLKVLKHYYPGYNLLDFEPGGAWITGHDEFVIEISKGKK